jgi:hypothetical protein
MIAASDFLAQHSGPSVELSPESRLLLSDLLFRYSLLREILRIEIEFRRNPQPTPPGYDTAAVEGIYWYAFLLFRAGSPADVIPLWRAKHSNFDTACGFDIEFLLGAGLEPTIQ